MLSVYKKLFWFFKQEKKSYLKFIIVLLLLSFLGMLPPRIVGTVIDKITMNQLDMTSLVFLGLMLLLIPVTIYCFNCYFHKNMNLKGHQLSRELRIRYLGKLFSHDSKLFEEYNKGELISRISNDMPSITQAATGLLSELVFCGSLMIFVIFTMIFTISLKLTIVGFAVVPIMFLILNVCRQRMRKYYKIHRKIFSKFFDCTLESIEGTKVVRAYTQEDEDFKKNEEAINNDINSWIKITKFEVLFGPLFEMTLAIATFLTFSYGSYLVITSQITPGDLLTFSMYVTMLSGPILALANIYNIINQANIASERFFEVMDKESEVTDDANAKNIFHLDTLEFKNVSFRYPFDEHDTIENVSFKINRGETVGIVGPTGSGKSTLIRQLLREFKMTDGEIFLNGKSIEDYKIDKVRDLVGYVPQVHVLFQGSVEENLLIGNPDADHEMKDYAVRLAAFKNDLNYMNEGMNTYVGESGTGLSGGQKQRLSIARAIVKDPEMLILDDSLSAVDAKTEQSIVNNLRTMRRDKTNIIISHRFSVIKNAEKIIVLSKGKIIEMGNHYELMQNDGWYAKQYDNQTKGGE